MLTIFDFQIQFPDEDSCVSYLYKKRWSDGFNCPKCQHPEAYYLKTRKSMQCKRCRHQVSVTAGTIFHKMHLPLLKILWACYWITTSKKGISAKELQRKLGLGSYKTAWTLEHKIRKAMKSSGKYPINGDVELDETFLGLLAPSDKKNRAFINVVVETDGKNIGRAYLEHLLNQSSDQIRTFVNKTVAPGVSIKTDGNTSYKWLKNEYKHKPHKMYDKKDNDKHLPKVHIVITNLKNWLRGTYNSMPGKHAQRYLDEFCFRFNRRWKIESMFDKLIDRAVITKNITYAELTG